MASSVPQFKPFIVLAGPSGCGKSSLLKMLFAEFPGKFGFSVSHTTRKPRPGEVDGVAYHFVSRDVIEAEIAQGKFVEHAEFSGNHYGTSIKAIADVQEKGQTCILDVDCQGVRRIKEAGHSATYIFLAPPSIAELERRLRGRGDTADDMIARRLKVAEEELAYAAQPGTFDVTIVNDTLDAAYAEFRTAVQRASA